MRESERREGRKNGERQRGEGGRKRERERESRKEKINEASRSTGNKGGVISWWSETGRPKGEGNRRERDKERGTKNRK